MKRIAILILPLLLVIASISTLVIQSSAKSNIVLTGTVEMREIDIASEVPGRIDSLFVSEGAAVHKGDLIAQLDSKQIDAKVEEARGAMDAARAKLELARNGARKEVIEESRMAYLQAKHQYELAEKTFQRIQRVHQDSVISDQQYDQVEFQYKAAQEQLNAARANYEMALNGARKEEIAAAEALFHQAEGAYREARAYQNETRIISPLDGEVSKVIVHKGEIAAAGYPVVTVINPDDVWIVLQLRETQMAGIKINSILHGRIPAINNQRYSFRVTYISPMADFATWKATNEKGDFDVRTFEIHLRPCRPIPGIRAGMTVHVEL
ncbi:MAG: HlyD family secretion protein [Candidatus Kryptoniota bacterium]